MPITADQEVSLQHVAIIMDGNNRYEKREKLTQGMGHAHGRDRLDPLIEHARRQELKVLTLFAFSSENWNRPHSEVDMLMNLFRRTIKQQIPKMQEHDIAMRFIGDRARLSSDIQELMAEAEYVTRNHKAMTVVIAMSYGGIWDMTQAARCVAKQVEQGKLRSQDIDESIVGPHLALSDLPPVDLLIRTGGEYRISNFLLWQAAYAELYFTDVLWPDFGPEHYDEAVAEFAQRQRRFGCASP